ncbi:MAG: acyl-CoA dehydrogenase family protein [Acidobacteria bacterium]|nr:acyl-CoA dehydrogenase family protein [Acidobacteriota bacterium]
MDFSIAQDTQKLLAEIREFIQAEVIPLEPQVLAGRFHLMDDQLEAKRAEVKARGWWSPFIPKELGGMGLRLMEYAHISEELGRSMIGHYLFNCQAPDVGNMEVLMHYGTPEQKQQYLYPLAEGKIRSCFSMTEPGYPGSNPVWMGTTAEKDGEDYVINGRKWFTSSADGAAFAIVMAVTNPEAESPHRRASQILVPIDTPGFNLVRNVSIMGEPGGAWLSHAEISYENCRVPQSNRLGPEGAGFSIAQERLGPGRIHHCMRWIGICERAFDLMCGYAAKRELSPGKPLGAQQIVQAWIAESRAEINASRLMVLQAAWKIDQTGTKSAIEEISVIKFYVAGVLLRVLDRAIQVHGALGITDDTPLAFWYRHERGARIYDGADEVHKSSVAKRVLRGYGVKV